jgi:hypothetical protein
MMPWEGCGPDPGGLRMQAAGAGGGGGEGRGRGGREGRGGRSQGSCAAAGGWPGGNLAWQGLWCFVHSVMGACLADASGGLCGYARLGGLGGGFLRRCQPSVSPHAWWLREHAGYLPERVERCTLGVPHLCVQAAWCPDFIRTESSTSVTRRRPVHRLQEACIAHDCVASSVAGYLLMQQAAQPL